MLELVELPPLVRTYTSRHTTIRELSLTAADRDDRTQ